MSGRTPSDGSLTSWKEIASYLGRSVRTVRRWETTEGLPVRRHLHRKASTVYALPDEIDAWLKERENQLEEEAAAPAAAVPEPAPRRWRSIAATVGWIALGVIAGWISRGLVDRVSTVVDSRTEPSKTFQSGDLENVLQGALERDIVRGAIRFCEDRDLDADCLLLRENVAQLRPHDFSANYEAAYALATYAADLERAQAYADRAAELLSDRIVSDQAEAAAWVLLFEARRHWAAGDAGAALDSAAELEETIDSWPPRMRSLLARDLGTLALALGRSEEARSWFARIADRNQRQEMHAWFLFAAGHKAELKRTLTEALDYREPFTAVLLAMVGETEQANTLLARAEPRRLSEDHAALARGAVAFFEGKTDQAIDQLQTTLGRMEESGDPVFFAGSDILAMARHSQGDLEGAIQALESTARQRDRAMFSSAGLQWVKCQSRLAGYYALAQMAESARATDEQLKLRLRFADVDFPVLGEIDQRHG